MIEQSKVLYVELPLNANIEMITKVIQAIEPDAEIACAVKLARITDEDEMIAAFVDVIMTKLSVHHRHLLTMMLLGSNSFELSKGDSTQSPRWAVNSISSKLNAIVPGALYLILHRTKTYMEDGTYKGVQYSPTELGAKVLTKMNKAIAKAVAA